ncbi:MAG: metallophosphoesterase family protein [Candidatus Aminicenantes bacterium RBG_16_66_30]
MIKNRLPAIMLAAAVLTSSCVYTSKSKTYASLLEKGKTREIQQGLKGIIRSNAEIIQELEQKPKKDWLRLAVIGDSVSRRNLVYKDLLASISLLDPPPDFVVNLGDFTRGNPEHFSYYFDTIKGYPLPILHLMGNHEVQFPGEMISRTVFGERDFFFDYADVRFIFMGSEKLGFPGPRLDWLEDKLKDDRPTKKIFLSHEFMSEAFTELFHGISSHFVEEIKNTDKVLELLDKYNVPLAVSGHLHRYYEKTYRGTVMIITGGGGQSGVLEPKAKQPLSTKEKHFIVIDLPTGAEQGLQMAISSFDRQGKPLFMPSFYQYGSNGVAGEPSMQRKSFSALVNDPLLPQYVVDLYKRCVQKLP